MKVCIWDEAPSHYNSDFFNALRKNGIDLEVRYIRKISNNRVKEGWSGIESLPKNELYINPDSIDDAISSLPDWKDRIHIVVCNFSIPFYINLIRFLIKNNVKWIHRGERSGINLIKFVHFNYVAYKIFQPIFFNIKGHKKYSALINKYALGALAIGETAKNDFIKWGVSGKKIEILPYSEKELLIPTISPSWFKKNEKYFIYAGSLCKRKGIDVLIEAFLGLNFQNPDMSWKLILIGKDKTNGVYHKLVKKYNLSDRVIFTGTIDNCEINKHIYYGDVFILPAFFDGWGMVLNEAASLKKPLISTDWAGASMHLIQNGENGFIVKAKDINKLKHAMQFYIDNPNKVKIHGEKSFSIFQNYTVDACVKKFISAVHNWI